MKNPIPLQQGKKTWWARQESNLLPRRYERPALTDELLALDFKKSSFSLKKTKKTQVLFFLKNH